MATRPTPSGRSRTTTQGSADANERQSIRIQATSGAFTLGFDPDGAGPAPAQTSADIPLNSTPATVDAALETLPGIGAGNVAVSSAGFGTLADPYSPYAVTFQGALGQTDVAELIVADGSVPLAIDPEYWIDIANVGPDATSGEITVRLALPSGITAATSTPIPARALLS